MPDLLLELFSEEIPARMQAQAAKDLERLVVGSLSDRGLLFEGVKSFAGPRRLTLAVSGLPAKQPDVSEEKKGPRVGAPQKAIEGFLRSAGVTLEQCRKQSDGKGEFYVAVIARKGRETAEVLSEILPEAIAKLPWPKSMRFPKGGAQRWVRPLHSILCTFDGEAVPFEFAGVTSGNSTRGHRFLSDGKPIPVRRFEDYEKALRNAHVILDAEERKEIVAHELKQKAFALGLEPIADEGLLNEVAGLAEWPAVLIGTIGNEFMDLPPEILQTSMRTHQKYFSLRASSFEASLRDAPQDDGSRASRHPEVRARQGEPRRMANKFALVSNMIAADGGKDIVAGNERVLRARLADAKFFWDHDRKRTLESRLDALRDIIYYDEYTYADKIDSIAAKASAIAGKIGADGKLARTASKLCKADLTSGLVGEFPELQGLMGSYYYLEHNPDGHMVADAIRDHYKPQGPNDTLPASDIGAAVAIADKLSTLYWLFVEGERPTGSRDPYGLRRAALGIVRIILERNYRLELTWLLDLGWYGALTATDKNTRRKVDEELRSFIADRLKVALKEKGTRHDLIDAVFSLGHEDDLVRLVARVEALQTFLKSEDGANLLTAYKRAANILRDEEKRDKTRYDGEPDPEAFVLPQEKALFVELAAASELIRAEVERERFVEAMGAMARLRGPVDAFFDKVTVNDKDARLRKNRLLLLSRLRATLHLVADFSKIEG